MSATINQYEKLFGKIVEVVAGRTCACFCSCSCGMCVCSCRGRRSENDEIAWEIC